MIFNTDISAQKISSLELIWENQNPSASFAAQTVNLPTGYSAFIIGFSNSSSTGTWWVDNYIYVPVGTSVKQVRAFALTGTEWDVRPVRRISSVVDGAITFGEGSVWSASDPTYRTANSYARPIAIYGLKFTV